MRNEGFTPQRIFQQASRSFYNSLLDIDLMDKGQSPNNRTGWFVEQDFIPRLESTASIVIQGVKIRYESGIDNDVDCLGISSYLCRYSSLGENGKGKVL